MADPYLPTPAQLFTDAVWGAGPDELSGTETLVLLLYARAAKRGADTAWLTQRRIMRECKIVSRETVVRVRRSLVEKGWLTPSDVVVLRGGVVTVYRMENPRPGTTIEPGEAEPGSVSGQGWTSPGSTIEHLRPLPGSMSGQGKSTRFGERTGSEEPGSMVVPLSGRPGSMSGHVGDTKVFDGEPDPVRSADTRGSIIEPGISPQDGPPFRGGSMSGARGGAQAHARVREAPEDPHHLSMNGKETLTREEALALLRRTLPPGKPLSRYPQPVDPPPSTDVDPTSRS